MRTLTRAQLLTQLDAGKGLAAGNYVLDAVVRIEDRDGLAIRPKVAGDPVRISGFPLRLFRCVNTLVEGITFYQCDRTVKVNRWGWVGGRALELCQCANTRVRHCGFDQHRGGYNLLAWCGTFKTFVEHCWFMRWGTACTITPQGYADAGAIYMQPPCNTLVASHCQFTNSRGIAFYADLSKEGLVDGVALLNSRIENVNVGVYLGAKNSRVSGVTYVDVPRPILWVKPNAGNAVEFDPARAGE